MSRPSLIASLLLTAAVLAWPAKAQPVSLEGGITAIVNAERFRVAGIDVKLAGVYAPEPGVIYGHSAQSIFKDLVAGRSVACQLAGTQAADGRVFARCSLDGVDLAALAVKAGAARDCPAESQGRYKSLEQPRIRELVALPATCL